MEDKDINCQITTNDYDPAYLSTMNTDEDDPEFIHTPPVHIGHYFNSPPEDTKYTKLAAQANSGIISCQYALIAPYRLRPYSDYKSRLNAEFKEEFMKRHGTEDVLAITVYEETPGQFIVASTEDDCARYEVYKSQVVAYVRCLVVGSFTKVWAVEPLDRPFWISHASYDPYTTAQYIARRIKKLQNDKKVSTFALTHIAGLTIEDYAKLSDPIHPEAPTIDALERIATVLGVSSRDILPF
jgi:hypothetical protein